MDAQSPVMLPLTPSPSNSSVDLCAEPGIAKDALSTALHVIRTERDALSNLETLYETNDAARSSFSAAVATISETISHGGRLIVSGVGKSGKIAQKCVATMNSLGIRSALLHPTEALHGDLGMVGENDTMLILTFSGRTAEVLSMLSYLPSHLPRIFVTGQSDESLESLLSQSSGVSIHLPAPIPVAEVDSFGLAAPTTSTTVALALTDALALASARHLHSDPTAIFKHYHPGGAIGGFGSGRG